jgi:hypothetical protein
VPCIDERLCHVKAATVALAETQRDVDPMVGRRRGDPSISPPSRVIEFSL